MGRLTVFPLESTNRTYRPTDNLTYNFIRIVYLKSFFAKPDKSTLPEFEKNEIFGFRRNWDLSGFARKLFFMVSLV